MKTVQFYNTAFIGASVLLNEMHIVASLYRELKDWDKVKKQVFENRLLQTRTEATAVRYFSELKARITGLSDKQIDIITNGSIEEQKQMIWWSICKAYTFIKEFAIEIIRGKFVLFDYAISHVDFIQFFDEKTVIDPSLAGLKDSTKKKQEQIIFRMLREASILDKNNNIIPSLLSERIIEALKPDKPESFLVFPVTETDLRRYI